MNTFTKLKLKIISNKNFIVSEGPVDITHAKILSSENDEPLIEAINNNIKKASVERKTIVQALNELKGNKTKTASKLGIPLSTLYYKLKKLDII